MEYDLLEGIASLLVGVLLAFLSMSCIPRTETKTSRIGDLEVQHIQLEKSTVMEVRYFRKGERISNELGEELVEKYRKQGLKFQTWR